MRYEIKNKTGDLIHRYTSNDEIRICDKCFYAAAGVINSCKDCYFVTFENDGLIHSFCFKNKEVKNKKSAEALAHFLVYGYNWGQKINSAKNEEEVNLAEYTSLLKISFHNSRTIVSNMRDKIFSLLDSDVESFSKESNKIDAIQQCIKNNSYKAAREILSCLKSAEQVLHEFTSVNFLHPQSIISDKLKGVHKIHTVYVLSFYMYESDFLSHYLKVETGQSDSKVYIHFETAKTAIAQILDNTLKYALKNSTISVDFEKTTVDGNAYVVIVFSMKSLMIRKSETSLFLQRDQRSMYAKALKIPGEGQGLFIAQKMLQLNDGFLKIETDDKPIKKQGRLYTNNTFRLYFREAID